MTDSDRADPTLRTEAPSDQSKGVLRRTATLGQPEPLLYKGMAALITGSSGDGTSALALQIALGAATHPRPPGAGAGLVALGLEVDPGHVVVANGEIYKQELDARLNAAKVVWPLHNDVIGSLVAGSIQVLGRDQLNSPLWRGSNAPANERGPTDAMRFLEERLPEDDSLTVLVIDPIEALVVDTPLHDCTSVRELVSHLTGLIPNGIVILVGRSPENDTSPGLETGEGIVGSHQWRDVTSLVIEVNLIPPTRKRQNSSQAPQEVTVEVVKADHGTVGPCPLRGNHRLEIRLSPDGRHPVGLGTSKAPEPIRPIDRLFRFLSD